MSETYKTLRCETCGGELSYSDDLKSAVCLNCGNEYHFNGEKSEALIIALNTANAKRIACDFDGASIDYKAVIGREPDDAEAHWGLVLSTYGIDYVEDPRTKNRIPTCRRTVKESILENKDYLAALNNAAPEQKEIYKEKAAIIDRLQKKIKRQLEDEEAYDVFISFKSTDEDGHPTEDRQIARRIYDELARRGIKTFFSEVTLKSRLGEDYEPIIYKALYSCKFFILVATSEENMNSAWVKNEWARYRDRVFDEALSNAGCAVFKNIKPIELPSFLRGQGIDLTKYPAGGYEVEIADGLSARLGLTNKNEEAEEIKRQLEEQKKLQQSLEDKLKVIESTSRNGEAASKTVQSMLMRAKQFAEAGEFENAISKINETLDVAPTCGEAWLNLFFWEQKTTSEKGLNLSNTDNCNVSDCLMAIKRNQYIAQKFQDKNFVNALKYADAKRQGELKAFESQVLNRIASIRNETVKKLISKGNVALDSYKFANAREAYDAVLVIDNANCYAYCGKFLVEIQANNLNNAAKKIINCELKDITKNQNLNNAFKFADAAMKMELTAFRNSVVALMNKQIEELTSQKKAALDEKQTLQKNEAQVKIQADNSQRLVEKYNKHSSIVPIQYGGRQLLVAIVISILCGVVTLGFTIFGRELLYDIIPLFDSWFRIWVDSNESALGTIVGFILSAIVMTLIVVVAVFVALSILRLIIIIIFTIPRRTYHNNQRLKRDKFDMVYNRLKNKLVDLQSNAHILQKKIDILQRNIQKNQQVLDYISTAIKI